MLCDAHVQWLPHKTGLRQGLFQDLLVASLHLGEPVSFGSCSTATQLLKPRLEKRSQVTKHIRPM